jgi:single-strand DNA-binding protein
VYIEGKLQTRSWEKDGITHYMTEIVASDVQFLGDKSEDAGNRPRAGGGGNFAQDRGYPEPPMPERQEDDIPF